jgi:hypothetical protein
VPDNKNAKERSSCVRASERAEPSDLACSDNRHDRAAQEQRLDQPLLRPGIQVVKFFIFDRSIAKPGRSSVGEKKWRQRDRQRNHPNKNPIWRIPTRLPTIWSDNEMPVSAMHNVLLVAFDSWGAYQARGMHMRITRSAAAAGMFLALAGLNACGGDNSVGAFVEPVPKALAITGGNAQKGFVTAKLDTSLKVAITDANGLPIIGTPVAWAVASGGGTLSRDTVTTDSYGESTVDWSLGNSVGPQTVTANAAGFPTISATFSATAVMPNVAIESGNNQTAAAKDTVADNPTIIVTDANGDPVPNVRVDFAIASGGGFLAGGNPDSATAASVITDSKGLAAITWILGPTVGTQTITAKVANGTPLTFTAIATTPVALNFDPSAHTILLAANRAVRVRAPWLGLRSI